jgi:hypothetical protein
MIHFKLNIAIKINGEETSLAVPVLRQGCCENIHFFVHKQSNAGGNDIKHVKGHYVASERTTGYGLLSGRIYDTVDAAYNEACTVLHTYGEAHVRCCMADKTILNH